MKATVLSLLSYIFMMRNSQRLRLYKFRLFPVSEPRNPLSWWTNSVSGCRSKAKCTWNVKTSTETVAVILPKIRAHIFLGEIDWIEQRTSKQTMQCRGGSRIFPSVCSYKAPLNWNSCPLVATLRRSTRNVFVKFRSYVVLNQLFAKALFARSCIVSSKGTLVKQGKPSYETKMSPFAISKLRISFANSKMSVTV